MVSQCDSHWPEDRGVEPMVEGPQLPVINKQKWSHMKTLEQIFSTQSTDWFHSVPFHWSDC